VTVELNGEPLDLAPGTTVATVVDHAGAAGKGRGVAVAVDGEVIPRSAWGTTRLTDGQRIEVLGAIQGG
jgi:sulfur carrier protein